MKRTPLKRVSRAMKIALAIYAVLRPKYLSEHPTCECKGCNRNSVDIHHTKKPRKKYMNAVDTWMAVCRTCHEEIENNKSWAREQGYLENF
tara:strand:+ start:389 stop:661 length:273 start_codon:yes stop_codon:yes gene_type:complete